MRVVFTHHVPATRRADFTYLLVPVIAALMRRIEDAAVHRLQPVAHVGQRAADDHAHRVIEIGALHLLDDGNRLDAGWAAVAAARCFLVSQIGSQSQWESLMLYIGKPWNSPMRPGFFPLRIETKFQLDITACNCLRQHVSKAKPMHVARTCPRFREKRHAQLRSYSWPPNPIRRDVL